MSETQESHESLHTEVEIKPTLNERALLAIGLHECQLCFKTFQNVDQLKSHELEHSSSADLFEDGLEPTDPSTSETSISVAAPTEEITIEEIKLEVEHEVEDDIDSDPKVPF